MTAYNSPVINFRRTPDQALSAKGWRRGDRISSGKVEEHTHSTAFIDCAPGRHHSCGLYTSRWINDCPIRISTGYFTTERAARTGLVCEGCKRRSSSPIATIRAYLKQRLSFVCAGEVFTV